MSKTITLTETQLWVVTKALYVLSSDEQTHKLRAEFPSIDFEKLEDDINDIIDQMEIGEIEDNEH